MHWNIYSLKLNFADYFADYMKILGTLYTLLSADVSTSLLIQQL